MNNPEPASLLCNETAITDIGRQEGECVSIAPVGLEVGSQLLHALVAGNVQGHGGRLVQSEVRMWSRDPLSTNHSPPGPRPAAAVRGPGRGRGSCRWPPPCSPPPPAPAPGPARYRG